MLLFRPPFMWGIVGILSVNEGSGKGFPKTRARVRRFFEFGFEIQNMVV